MMLRNYTFVEQALDRLTVTDTKRPVVLTAGAAVLTIVTVQVFTNADPLGRCWRFWRQLGSHVSVATFCPFPVEQSMDSCRALSF